MCCALEARWDVFVQNWKKSPSHNAVLQDVLKRTTGVSEQQAITALKAWITGKKRRKDQTDIGVAPAPRCVNMVVAAINAGR